MINLSITEDDYNEVLQIITERREHAAAASIGNEVRRLSALISRIHEGVRGEGRKTKLMEDKERGGD